MPSLAELSDLYPQQDNTLPVEQPYLGVPQDADGIRRVYINTGNVDQSLPIGSGAPAQITPQTTDINGDMANTPNASSLTDSPIIKKLFGLDGEERYQTWPEKVVREALAAPHDTLNTSEPVTSDQLVAPAQAISALAGTGGLAGADASLGSTAFLRPALKYENKIYKAPIGGQHLDALPAHLVDDFQAKAMNGEDINSYNFGFMNHKGQFLDREKALDYAIKEGLVDQSAGQYGALTSTLMADSSKPGTAIEAMAKTAPFYSALEHNVNAIQQGKMSGDQWLGTLSNKPGVKPEEMDWTGVKSFLEERGKQPVTKAELQEHLQNNKVEIKDVDKGGETLQHKSVYDPENEEWDIEDHHGHTVDSGYRDQRAADREILRLAGHNQSIDAGAELNRGTQYHSHQLPGGENYREKLLTLPDRQAQLEGWNKANRLTEAERKELVELQSKNGVSGRQNYKSSHWDEPNILAHIRMNDRIIDGRKSLHIEEIQSDWHQQGKKAGYDDPTFRKAAEEKLNKAGYPVSSEDARLAFEDGKITKEEADAIGNRSYIPNAPFKKTWHKLALKRMIREASEKGYDRLSWTPGEAQAARYDLSKQIDKLSYDPKSGHLQGFKDGGMALDNIVPKDKLPDFVGKEATDKILNKPTKILGNGYHTLENADLKVGGEGMKGFYDQIIPKALEKISGEKVKTANIAGKESTTYNGPSKTIDELIKLHDDSSLSRRDNIKLGDVIADMSTGSNFKEAMAKHATDYLAAHLGGEIKPMASKQPIHYIDIPQALKDKALGKGFSLFSSTHMYTPIAGNPFSQDKKK